MFAGMITAESAYIDSRSLLALIPSSLSQTGSDVQVHIYQKHFFISKTLTIVNDIDILVNRKRHQNKEIERAIQFAESLGWRVRKASGAAHPFGVLRCPHNSKKCRCGVFCQVSVWSTPRNPVAHARRILRAVENCIYEVDQKDGRQVDDD